MRSLVSLLLLPLFVLGQVLPSHAGSHAFEADGHANRPHLHFGGHHHHGVTHHHGGAHDRHHEDHEIDDLQTANLVITSLGHDSDAIYLPESRGLAIRVLSTEIDLLAVPRNMASDGQLFVRSHCISIASHPMDLAAALPVYLLIASLRL
ncbi:MAG: hypothetical protein AAGG48_01565 [Planctomycetota bacterium]